MTGELPRRIQLQIDEEEPENLWERGTEDDPEVLRLGQRLLAFAGH
jgi:hypothetical protein